MNEEQQLAQLHEKLYKESVEMPEQQERAIEEAAIEVANKMVKYPKALITAEFEDKKYSFMIVSEQKIDGVIHMLIKACDLSSVNKITRKGRMLNIACEIDNGLSLFENLKNTFIAFYHSESGNMQVGEIE